MQFFRIAEIRPSLISHGVNRSFVQSAHPAGERIVGAAQADRTRPSFLERSIVKEGIGIRIQDLMRHRGGSGCFDGICDHAPLADVTQKGLQASRIHGFVQAITNSLIDQRMIH